MSSLPSMTALRAFEAAARHKSMSRAADELFVSHGAVSRHIRALEAEFGFPLFHRGARSVRLTDEGARLAAALSSGFQLIAEAVSQLRPGAITVSCAATFMTRWLIPRLGRFKKAHPSIDLRLTTGFGALDLAREGVSVALRNDGVMPPPGITVSPLIREWIGPVCSPDYARARGFRSVSDLARVRRLASRSRPDAWEDWRVSFGAPLPPLPPHEEFEELYLLFQAAACGLGVGIGLRYLVEEDLRLGRLVAPLGFVEGQRQLVLWSLPHADVRADVRGFIDWLEEELRITESCGAHAGVPTVPGRRESHTSRKLRPRKTPEVAS